MRLLHDSHLLAFRTPFGAVPVKTPVTLRLAVFGEEEPTGVFLRLWQEQETLIAMHCESIAPGSRTYRADFSAPEEAALIWYSFQVTFSDGIVFYGDQADGCVWKMK